RLKPVVRVLDDTPLPTAELLATLQWAARYYQHPLGEVLQAALPVAMRSARPLPVTGIATLVLTDAGAAAVADPARRRGTRIDRLLEALAHAPLPLAGARTLAGSAGVRSLLARGWAERSESAPPAVAPSAGLALNEA